MNKQQVEYIDHMGDDTSVVRAAKVSFANDEEIQKFLMRIDVEGTDVRSHEALVEYLANHNHWTPFAHTAITLRVKAAIPIRTQCFKHKQGFVENEESRRYISTTPEYYMPTFRKSVEKKKQGSGRDFDKAEQGQEEFIYKGWMDMAIQEYERALARGVCEEQARLYLPQGMMVNWYWTGSLAAFARFANLRLDSHAQVEIQELAKQVSDIIRPLYPVCWKSLVKE